MCEWFYNLFFDVARYQIIPVCVVNVCVSLALVASEIVRTTPSKSSIETIPKLSLQENYIGHTAVIT